MLRLQNERKTRYASRIKTSSSVSSESALSTLASWFVRSDCPEGDSGAVLGGLDLCYHCRPFSHLRIVETLSVFQVFERELWAIG